MSRFKHTAAIGSALLLHVCISLPALAADFRASPAVIAAIEQRRAAAQWLPALADIEQAAHRAPNDPRLYRLRVLTLSDLGNAQEAWRQMQARPELFDASERERIELDRLSRLVRWSTLRTPTEENRLEAAQTASAEIDAYVASRHGDITQAPERLRIDHLIVLNQLGRHAEVAAEYALLRNSGPLPAYALGSVADSHLALHRPREAAAILDQALAADPDDAELQVMRAYADLEREAPAPGLARLRSWGSRQPTWTRLPGGQPQENWERYQADHGDLMITAYTGDLPQAQAGLERMLAQAPADAGRQASLGQVYLMRGWPEQAHERFHMAGTLDDQEVNAQIGLVEAYTALQRDDLVAPIHDRLLRLHPGQANVQRMDAAWRRHRGWQWRLYGGRGRSDGTVASNSPVGNRDGVYGLDVESPVLADRWRLLAFAESRWADFDARRTTRRHEGIGARYAFDRLDAALRVSRQHGQAFGTGVALDAGWRFNDRWSARAGARRHDADASLQALAAGIDADSWNAGVDYRRSERTAWSMTVDATRFDDGNRRTALFTALQQRLHTRPRFMLEGFASAAVSRGRRIDTPYFNPSRDASLALGLRADQVLWRDYDRHFRHRLTASTGPYWQQDFGRAWTPALRYEHEWQIGLGRTLLYGVSWSRPVYDGQREDYLGFDAEFRWGE